MAENHRERNRRRRERNAFRNLYPYAQEAGIADPKRAAEQAARAMHGGTGEPVGRAAAPPRQKAAASGGKAAKPGGKAAAGGGKAAKAGGGKTVKAPATGGKAEKVAASAQKSTAPAKTQGDEKASVPHRLEDRTREQLYARAQELEIEGRSQMSKAELIEEIRKHS
jgi:hypothetical protein